MAAFDLENGLDKFDSHLEDNSYVVGYTPSQSDSFHFDAICPKKIDGEFPNVARWFSHIASFTACQRAAFPGKAPAAGGAAAAAPAKAAAAEEDDGLDFGGSDDDEDAAAIIAAKKAKDAAAAAAATTGKKGVIPKSLIVLEIKPFEAETDMAALEAKVREIEMEGLLWGGSDLKEIAYGIQKLIINAVVHDEICSVDDLQDKIAEIEDVQSNDIAAFNKL